MEGSKHRPRRLGERLIDHGFLTEEQLGVALEQQKRVHVPFGQIVCDLGFVTQAQLATVLAEEAGVPLVSLAEEIADPLVLTRIRADHARSNRVIPLRIEDGELVIAMADPSDIYRVDEISQQTGYPLRVVAAVESEILDSIRRYYGEEESFAFADIVESAAKAPRETSPDGESSVEKIVDGLLRQAIRKGATDLHVEPEEKLIRVRYRVDGFLHQGENLPVSLGAGLVSRFKILSRLDIAEKRRPQDGRLRYEIDQRHVDLRLSTMPTSHGENIVVRILDSSTQAPKLSELGMTETMRARLHEIAQLSHGMFLVTGPTGSGKTTTLYATLGVIDALSRKVTTIEDPIECQIPMIRQSQVDPGVDYSIADGLRAMLRQDPDVILVGEIRDRESADVALRAAITGHLVLSSLHTNTAAGAVPRLLDLGLEPYLVQSAVSGVLAQRLVRKICRGCIQAYEPTTSELDALGFDLDEAPRELHRGAGCPRCQGSGFVGRTGIFELLIIDDEIGRAIGRGASEREISFIARESGVGDILGDARDKVVQGETSVMEILRVYKAQRSMVGVGG